MGERRGSNPRMLEPQPSALTTWLRSPLVLKSITKILNFFYLKNTFLTDQFIKSIRESEFPERKAATNGRILYVTVP